MRELLEKAHQEDEDELFREVEDDEEFAAPRKCSVDTADDQRKHGTCSWRTLRIRTTRWRWMRKRWSGKCAEKSGGRCVPSMPS
jgi:hypothetical protein